MAKSLNDIFTRSNAKYADLILEYETNLDMTEDEFEKRLDEIGAWESAALDAWERRKFEGMARAAFSILR